MTSLHQPSTCPAVCEKTMYPLRAIGTDRWEDHLLVIGQFGVVIHAVSSRCMPTGDIQN